MRKINEIVVYSIITILILTIIYPSLGCCGSCCGGDDGGGGSEAGYSDWGGNREEVSTTPTIPTAPPDPCAGIRITDIDVLSLTKTDLGSQFHYEADFSIKSCKQDITYEVYLMDPTPRKLSIGRGFLTINETLDDTYSNMNTIDFTEICIDTTDPAKEEYCQPTTIS